MPATHRSTSTSARVFFAWLLTSTLVGSLDAGLAFCGLPVASTFREMATVALVVCLLGAPVLWWLSIRTVKARGPGGHSRFDSQERLHELIDNLPAIVARFDGEQRCLFANQRALQIQSLTHAVDRLLSEALPAAAYAMYAEHIPIVMSGRRTAFEGSDMRNGKLVHYLVTLIPERDARGSVTGFFLMTSDITAVKHAQSEVRRSEGRLRAITNNLPVMICSIDTCGLLQFANRTFEMRTGVAAEAAAGRPFRELVGEATYLQAMAAIDCAMGGTRSQFEVATDFEGTRRYWQGVCVPDFDSQGVVTCVYALLTDITAVRRSELNMAELALTDSLTGLPNRRRLDEQLPNTLAHAHRQSIGFALLFLDIDHFKQVNDHHGHAIGDAVLTEFARRLRGAVRSSDCVARYAGDEFVVILSGVSARRYAEQVAAEIVQKMRDSMRVGKLMLTVTTSIGVAYLAPGGLAEVQLLLDSADHALYQAKARGRNGFSTCEVGTSADKIDLTAPTTPASERSATDSMPRNS